MILCRQLFKNGEIDRVYEIFEVYFRYAEAIEKVKG